MFISKASFKPVVLSLALVASIAAIAPEVLAQSAGDPFASIADKGTELRDNLITIGNVAIGVIVVVLAILAVFGRVAWSWVITAFVGAVVLNLVVQVQSWLTS